INVVALKGFSEPEVLAFAQLARQRPYQVRFVERMPLGGNGDWNREGVLSVQEILTRVSRRWPLNPQPSNGGPGPALRYSFADGRGEIGVIPAVTQPFCHRCNRLRLLADGKLLACLFSESTVELRPLLREGGTDAEIARAIEGAAAQKERGHRLNERDYRPPARSMHAVGG
ncbi:MAG: GTP 3',8-cyclase MoaA, partial [Armatimonadota bacterium]|nr:GTP 3',8-cyclase MoaA [Armatimonadota bacterium]